MKTNPERSKVIEKIRGQVVGPSRPFKSPRVVEFKDGKLLVPPEGLTGPICWQPSSTSETQEVIYWDRETPANEYGAGVLYPQMYCDTSGDSVQDGNSPSESEEVDNEEVNNETDEPTDIEERAIDAVDFDFPVSSDDIYKPSSMAISFSADLSDDNSSVEIKLPRLKRFFWQSDTDQPFQVNGWYELMSADGKGAWRRNSISENDIVIRFTKREIEDAKKPIQKDCEIIAPCPLRLLFELFPRRYGSGNVWVFTLVLKNINNDAVEESRQPGNRFNKCLFQSYFEVSLSGGKFHSYLGTQRKPEDMDEDESTLSLLYSNSETWAIGHACSAGWDGEYGAKPTYIYADSLPAVELPSMTPDIEIEGKRISFSMRELYELDSGPNYSASGWARLDELLNGYKNWILKVRDTLDGLDEHRRFTAKRHIEACEKCFERMLKGLSILKDNPNALKAFKLTNHAMLIQQLTTKGLKRINTVYDTIERRVRPRSEDHLSPIKLFNSNFEKGKDIGKWRAFQLAFLLMSLDGVYDPKGEDREIVDLIWFPTGGGKTEAYLGVMAFLMFYKRLAAPNDGNGTVALMRYTLRMLTTQQFQRASSLICSMEYLRRRSENNIPGARFSIGLWLGAAGSPNNKNSAKSQLERYKAGKINGNPMILTECPWCRCSIGVVTANKPSNMTQAQWREISLAGVKNDQDVPRLVCPDSRCEFGGRLTTTWLPVEVIDDEIYKNPPSLVIATADKFAMLSYKPEAGSIFGIKKSAGQIIRTAPPPSLIIQDELHLISGPLGTMYGLYETVIERLCSEGQLGRPTLPKIIASTATIRSAKQQVKSLYNRDKVQMFPSPGIDISDSFFGKYARNENDGSLCNGRLYLGIHANNYSSSITAQVRTFSTALHTPCHFNDDTALRDPWWTLLAYHNSIRELGSSKTLFDSDIGARLQYLSDREGVRPSEKRNVDSVPELTSRLGQAEIIHMMDMLNVPYAPNGGGECLSACLTSNIIEVGVDIERLSIMAVVGQPLSSSSYIQVSGRVGRRWWERPGLILVVYNTSKSRDRSHYEQFHSYHRRLYERVEPTSATPFSIAALRRGMAGAVIAWARQQCGDDDIQNRAYKEYIEEGCEIIRTRCSSIISDATELDRTLKEIDQIEHNIILKLGMRPQYWSQSSTRNPTEHDSDFLMLWPGNFYNKRQQARGIFIPTSMRQVDTTSELNIF